MTVPGCGATSQRAVRRADVQSRQAGGQLIHDSAVPHRVAGRGGCLVRDEVRRRVVPAATQRALLRGLVVARAVGAVPDVARRQRDASRRGDADGRPRSVRRRRVIRILCSTATTEQH
jgi:hypothetical protein